MSFFNKLHITLHTALYSGLSNYLNEPKHSTTVDNVATTNVDFECDTQEYKIKRKKGEESPGKVLNILSFYNLSIYTQKIAHLSSCD